VSTDGRILGGAPLLTGCCIHMVSTEGVPAHATPLRLISAYSAVHDPAHSASWSVQPWVLALLQITLADIIAFAGAMAIEATGGPRVVVQLGRWAHAPLRFG
jgi:hypothetical protein